MHPNSYNLSQFRLIASWIDSKVFVPRFLFSVEQNIFWFKSFLQILTTVSLSHSLCKQAQTVWAKAGGTFLKTYDSAQLPTFQLLRRKTYFFILRHFEFSFLDKCLKFEMAVMQTFNYTFYFILKLLVWY